VSDDLIERLSAELKPVSPRLPGIWLGAAAVVGVIVAAAIMIPWIGLRPDMARVYLSPVFWAKFAYTVAFAGLGIWAAIRLARPGGSIRAPLIGVFVLIAATGALGIVQMLLAGPQSMRALVMGGTALVCPFYVLALSVPVYVIVVVVMRRLAPTNLAAAGFAAGLMAGAVGCWVYAFHCTESGLPFIAIWYSAGILLSALLGALAGRFLLRW
jgi:hypothetical protein